MTTLRTEAIHPIGRLPLSGLGDVILSVDGVQISTKDELRHAIVHAANTKITFAMVREHMHGWRGSRG